MKTGPNLYELPVASRPRKTWMDVARGVPMAVVFNLGCLMIICFQFTLLLPLKLLPLSPAQRLYEEGIRYSKGAFGTLLGTCAATGIIDRGETKGYRSPRQSVVRAYDAGDFV